MKVYIGGYRNHWLSPYSICETACFWRSIDYDEPWVKRVNKLLDPVMKVVQRLMDFVHPYIRYVKIDRYDSWSADHTLALIILPVLQQLKETKHGAPYVDDADVPEELRSTAPGALNKVTNEYDLDLHFFARWDYVMDEMIWAFSQQVDDDAESQFFEHPEHNDDELLMDQVSRIKIDKEGLAAWQARKSNGFRLFGKYFESLWD